MHRVQFSLVLCLMPISVLAMRMGQRQTPNQSPLKQINKSTLMANKGPPKFKGMRGKPGCDQFKGDQTRGDHILTKMTHMEKIFNFCDLYGVKQAKESYGSDFFAFDRRSKTSCGRLRCMGNNHICCPVTGKFNATSHTDFFCLSNTEEHRGYCPPDMTHVTHLEYGTAKKLSESGSKIMCRRDADCRLNEKCCLSEEQSYTKLPWFDRPYSQKPDAWQMKSTNSIQCRPSEDIEDTSAEDYEIWDDADEKMPMMKLMRMVDSFLK